MMDDGWMDRSIDYGDGNGNDDGDMVFTMAFAIQ